MIDDISNDLAGRRSPDGQGDRDATLLFPENKSLCEALEYLNDLIQDEGEPFYEGFRRDGKHRVEEGIVSHAKFLLPIDVWDEDLARDADGSLSIKDGAGFDPCVIGFPGSRYDDTTYTYLPLFTDWNALYKQPYPGHVHALVVTFEDCLRLIEKDGDGRGIAVNPGSQQQFFYEREGLTRLAELRESLVEAGRVDGNWSFGTRRRQSPSVVLRGPQDRVRLYLPGRFGMTDCTDDDMANRILDTSYGTCFDTVPLAASTRDQLREVLRALFGRVHGSGVWEVYAAVDCDTPFLIGRILWDRDDPSTVKVQILSESCPATNFIYCEFLNESALMMLEIEGGRIVSGFERHLQETLRYCALDNTYLTGCSYTYLGEDAAREYARKSAEGETRKPSAVWLVTIPMMLLGALLTYVTRAALWPGLLAPIGCVFLMLVLPVAGSEGLLYLMLRSRITRIARELMGEGSLPSAGQHHARFSMRPGCALYRDGARELQGDGTREFVSTEHYLFCSMRHGVKVPISKSAL